jgi:YidC/Oxa1 family membrane protein insertase
MQELWNTFLYEPFYNILAIITNIVPFGDVGLAVIALTILVKVILYPATKKSIEGQMKMKMMEPELTSIKAKYTDKQEQAKKTMELYKKNNTNPFSGCLTVIVQIPIILALYTVFLKGFSGGETALYSFVTLPAVINTSFLGLINVESPNTILAILAGASQFIQLKLSLGASKDKTPVVVDNSKFGTQNIAQAMQTQMLYILPIVVVVIGFKLSAAVALYWITSNIVTAWQEYKIRQSLVGFKAIPLD